MRNQQTTSACAAMHSQQPEDSAASASPGEPSAKRGWLLLTLLAAFIASVTALLPTTTAEGLGVVEETPRRNPPPRQAVTTRPQVGFWERLREPNAAEIAEQSERAELALRSANFPEASLAASQAVALAQQPSPELLAMEAVARGLAAGIVEDAPLVHEAAGEIVAGFAAHPEAFDSSFLALAPAVLFVDGRFDDARAMLRRQQRRVSSQPVAASEISWMLEFAMGPPESESNAGSENRNYIRNGLRAIFQYYSDLPDDLEAFRTSVAMGPAAAQTSLYARHTTAYLWLLRFHPEYAAALDVSQAAVLIERESLAFFPPAERASRHAIQLEARGDMEGAAAAWREAESGPWADFARQQRERVEAQ